MESEMTEISAISFKEESRQFKQRTFVSSDVENSKFWNVPNMLTVFRILLSPLFIVFFLSDHLYATLCALAIVCLSEITDLLDGYFARIRSEGTEFGKILDPLADSLSRLTVFVCFLHVGYISVWMLIPILYRDILVSTLRTVAAMQNVVIAARKSGKIKAIVQGTVIIIVVTLEVVHRISMLHHRAIVYYLMWIVVMVTSWSAYDYIRGNFHVILPKSRRQ
jgi:CDP-diacylglycerol--glycerol-3-phosphate 3-phosphatidyltransferase